MNLCLPLLWRMRSSWNLESPLPRPHLVFYDVKVFPMLSLRCINGKLFHEFVFAIPLEDRDLPGIWNPVVSLEGKKFAPPPPPHLVSYDVFVFPMFSLRCINGKIFHEFVFAISLEDRDLPGIGNPIVSLEGKKFAPSEAISSL